MIGTHAAAALVAAGIAFAGGWKVRDWSADRQAAETAAATASQREQAMHAALVETTRRLTAQQEAADAAAKRARQARADAADAGAAADRLREHAAQLAARAGACDPAAAAGGAAASAPGVVLADMLQRVEAHGRDAAAAADAAATAGEACERSYEALTVQEARP